ncbi:MAG TPA: hypothetical protein VK524_00545, partial [Polyangiaceae bacterium]|nr:hypothetical protein [Polyangiaceae bacterium]
MRPRCYAFVLAMLCLPLAGCGKMKKTTECNAFIEKVNTSLKEIEKHTNTKGTDQKAAAQDMKKLAGLYDKLATDVAALGVTTPDLKKHADDYQAMAKKAADTARQVAEAVETNNLDKAQTAQKEFDGIVKQED